MQALVNNQHSKAKIYKRIAEAADHMEAVCNEKLVKDNETAALIGEGFDLTANLSAEEQKKFQKMSVEEGIRYIANMKGDSDMDAQAMVAAKKIIQKAMDKMRDGILGSIPSQKNMHSEGLEDEARYSRIVTTGITTTETAGFDMGWTAALTAQDAQDVKQLEVLDLKTAARFYELQGPTDDIPASKVGGKTNQKLGRRFFGSRLEWHERENRWNAFSLNTLLGAMRTEAMHTISRLMYSIIFEVTNSTVKLDDSVVNNAADFVGQGADGGAKDLNQRILVRKIMNQAHYKLVNMAGQLQPDLIEKKYQNLVEAPIAITPNDPILFYYNHEHFELMDTVGNPGQGPNDVRYNVPMLRNWVPISTAMAPVCGGHTVTGRQTDTTRNDWGLLGTRKDINPGNVVGGMAMIPGRRNMYGIFRGLTFLSERHQAGEYTEYVARMEYNAFKDIRQHAYIKLIDYSQW